MQNTSRPTTQLPRSQLYLNKMLVIFAVIAFLASDCFAIHVGLITEQTQMIGLGADLELDETQREKLKEMVHAEQQARALAKQ